MIARMLPDYPDIESAIKAPITGSVASNKVVHNCQESGVSRSHTRIWSAWEVQQLPTPEVQMKSLVSFVE